VGPLSADSSSTETLHCLNNITSARGKKTSFIFLVSFLSILENVSLTFLILTTVIIPSPRIVLDKFEASTLEQNRQVTNLLRRSRIEIKTEWKLLGRIFSLSERAGNHVPTFKLYKQLRFYLLHWCSTSKESAIDCPAPPRNQRMIK